MMNFNSPIQTQANLIWTQIFVCITMYFNKANNFLYDLRIQYKIKELELRSITDLIKEVGL
jgi:hypothetical protein